MIGTGVKSIGRPARQTNKTIRVPAPVKGVDTRVASSEGSPLNCVYTFNLMPNDQDLKLRKGFVIHQQRLINQAGGGVRTIVVYEPIKPLVNESKIFAVTNEGIWDVTTQSAAPELKLFFEDRGDEAGWGNYLHYINDAGNDFIFYADSINGLFRYTSETDSWGRVTSDLQNIPAVDPDLIGINSEKINFVLLHQERLWFGEQDSTTLYYLDVGAFQSGAEVSEFEMGGKMPTGGSVVGAFSWAVDTGGGLDALLVIVNRTGGVLVYSGKDPDAEDGSWRQIGEYDIGRVPLGSRFGTEHGGNLYLLSIHGLYSMNDLLKGVDSEALITNTDSSTPSNKITSLIREAMITSVDRYGWEVRIAPSEGVLVVNSPKNITSLKKIQYVFSLNLDAWGFWRDLPMNCFDTVKTNVVFGTTDNKIMVMKGYKDNVDPNPPQGTSILDNGDDIEFSVLTSAQSYGDLGLFKRVRLVRPDYISATLPKYEVKILYDYTVDEPKTDNFIADEEGVSLWDISRWDEATWTTGKPSGINRVSGARGIGRYVAIALRGKAREKLSLVGFDVTYITGGTLL